MSKRLTALAAILALTGAALAQDAIGGKQAPKETQGAKATTLGVGDKAPAISVEKFLKGDAVTGFEKGKVYVVEFWATWCAPCIASMPHISELQKEYKDKGVTFIGVNIWEHNYKEPAKQLADVQDFVSKKGDGMAYTVAYDGPAKAMDKAYMQAAGQHGIPTAFLIDQSGTIAWIGHPMNVELPVEILSSGKYDAKAAQEEIKKAEKLQKEIYKADSPEASLAAIEKYESAYPKMAASMADMKMQLYMQTGQYPKAYAIAAKQVDDAISHKNAMTLNEIAWMIVDPQGDVKDKNLDLALKAATKANEFTEGKDAAILDTLARVYFVKGDKAKAIELEKQAVANAKGQMKQEAESTLKEYEDAK